MSTAENVYESSVVSLPKSERLKLAALILGDLAESAGAALDFSDAWAEEDVSDVATFAADYAAAAYGEETDYA